MAGTYNGTAEFLKTCAIPLSSAGSGSAFCAGSLQSRCGALLGEGCPEDGRWLRALADRIPRQKPIFVNVGANKGYGIAAFLQLFSQRNVTGRMWYHHIQGFARKVDSGFLLRDACGPCGSCSERTKMVHARNGGVAHGLELTMRNRELLRTVASYARVADLVHVHDLVGSNETRSMWRRNDTLNLYGSETGTLCRGYSRTSRCTQPTQAIRLDDFFDAHLGSGVAVYHVLIDAEGWDALVLEGMRNSLLAKRVAIFSFEYTYKGYWSAPEQANCRPLSTLLSWIGNAGYQCFWQTKRHLVPASGECLSEELHGEVGWSSLLCAHEPAALAVLYEFTPTRALDIYDAFPTTRREGVNTKVFTRATIVNSSSPSHRSICMLRPDGKGIIRQLHCNCRVRGGRSSSILPRE